MYMYIYSCYLNLRITGLLSLGLTINVEDLELYEKSNCLPVGPVQTITGNIFSFGMTWPQEKCIIRLVGTPHTLKSLSLNSETGSIVPPASITLL